MQFPSKLAGALALSLLAATSQAKVVASSVYSANWFFTTATAFVPLLPSGVTTKTVTIDSAGTYALIFSAECSVDAPAGNDFAWIDLDILVDGVAVSPTDNGANEDAFCGSDGTEGFSSYSRNSITVPVKFTTIGNHKIQVRARLDGGATGGWVSDITLTLI